MAQRMAAALLAQGSTADASEVAKWVAQQPKVLAMLETRLQMHAWEVSNLGRVCNNAIRNQSRCGSRRCCCMLLAACFCCCSWLLNCNLFCESDLAAELALPPACPTPLQNPHCTAQTCKLAIHLGRSDPAMLSALRTTGMLDLIAQRRAELATR